MSFGWSAGDIAAAITLAYNLIQALDTVDGAASDYREATFFLQHLLRTLEPLQAFTASNAAPVYGKGIGEQVGYIKEPVEKFLAKVLKYEPSLGAKAKEGHHRHVFKKLQWHVVVSKKVLVLRSKIESHMRIIDTLMQRLTLDAVRATQQQLPDTLRVVFQQTIRPELIAALQESLSPLNSDRVDKFQEVYTNRDDLLTARWDGHHEDLSKHIREIKEDLKHSKMTQLRIEAGINANGPSQKQLAIPTTQVGESFDQHLIPTGIHSTHSASRLARESLVEVYYLVFLYLGHFLKNLFLVLSRLAQPTKALMPLLLAHQNISFLDAIGRPPRILPFEFFRSYKVFQAFIEHEFRDLPGSAWVNRGKYHLSNMATNRTLDAKIWSIQVAPGATVAMSMIVRRRLALMGSVESCPEDTCSGTWAKSDTQSWITCPVCQKQIRNSLPFQGDSLEQDLNDRQQSDIQKLNKTTRPATPPKEEVEEVDSEVDEDLSPFKRITQEIIDTASTKYLDQSNANIAPSRGSTAIVQYDYERGEENEIDLVDGELITNIEFIHEDWWSGYNAQGKAGLFPSNYVELEDISAVDMARADSAIPPKTIPTVVSGITATAQYDYEAAEDNELSFTEDDIITNIEFPDDDWWFGTCGKLTGLFPSNYVELNA